MLVSIPCTGCSAPVGVTDVACGKCGRKLTRTERVALEARFEATNVDFRNAKTAVNQALIISLVVGLLTCVFGAVRLIASSASDPEAPPAASGMPLDLVFGLGLIGCFVAGRRAPVAAIGLALALWIIALVLPFLEAPASAVLAFASPGGVVRTLARVAVLIGLVRGLAGGISMRRLLSARPG